MKVPQRVQVAHGKNWRYLMKLANVRGVACGFRYKDGKLTNDVCIVVNVAKKLPKAQLKIADRIPDQVDGVRVDVFESKTFEAQSSGVGTSDLDPRRRIRPAVPGSSIGHKSITAGTFGCVVLKNGSRVILSNNHVLAASNAGQIGDDVYQPGTADGGSSADLIGRLHRFVRIAFTGDATDPGGPPTCGLAKATASVANKAAQLARRRHRLVAVDAQAAENEVDAAIAMPTSASLIDDHIIHIGLPRSPIEGELGMEVQKFGRTTGYTKDTITQVGAVVQVNYGGGRIAVFTGQLIAGAMSAGGDSGSVILDMNSHLVGLLFAGSEQLTIMNPIQRVFELLGVSLFGGQEVV